MSDILTLSQEQKALDQLFQIQTQAAPTTVQLLPNAKNVYNINLNDRSVEAPKVISVSKDHKSTVIYFKIDRYFDYMDLTNTVCLIQYFPVGEKKSPYIYAVPFYNTTILEDKGQIIFPWVVNGAATQKEGDLRFAIRFYRVDDSDGKISLVYNLNTTPVTTKVLYGLEADDETMKLEYDDPIASRYESLIAQLSNQRTEWTIL